MSVDVKWTDKGATISTLNAVKEFPILTKDVVDKAIDDGTLETKEGRQIFVVVFTVLG